jgi:hypothetical protein
MDDPRSLLRVYGELADGYAERDQPQFRDRFLILAADAALSAGDRDEAERCRQRLLSANPNHLLKPYHSFAQAMEAADVRAYVEDLRGKYPADVAAGLQQSLHQVKEREGRRTPESTPLIDFSGAPDLLMSDENEPIKLFSLRDDHPSGLPPTLPPERLQSATKPAQRAIPPTLFDVEPPQAPPPRPAPPPRQARPAPAPVRPVVRDTPAPRVPARELLAGPQPATDQPVAGAWLPTVLFATVTVFGVALIFYALVYPFVGLH